MALKFLSPMPRLRFFTTNGVPLVGGKLYTYAAGSTTPKATFTDESGDSANTNPIILDSSGEADVWLTSGYYKFVLKDSLDVLQWERDRISATSMLGNDSPVQSISNVITGGWYAPAGNGAVKAEEFGQEIFKFQEPSLGELVINKLIKLPLSYAGGDIEVRMGAYTPSFSTDLFTNFPTFKFSLSAALIKKDAVTEGFRVDDFTTSDIEIVQVSCLPATFVNPSVIPGEPNVFRKMVLVFADNGTLDGEDIEPEDYLFLQLTRKAHTPDANPAAFLEDPEETRLIQNYLEVIFS